MSHVTYFRASERPEQYYHFASMIGSSLPEISPRGTGGLSPRPEARGAEWALPGPTPWRPGPRTPVLGPNQAHLWRLPLVVTSSQLAGLGRLLSDEERERAARYRFARDRMRFIAAHGQLRLVLGRYLAAVPERLAFTSDAQGKPFITPPVSGAPGLAFNLSHSEAWAVCAVARNGPVGVDVEQLRQEFDGAEVLRHFFRAEEEAWLAARPAGQRQAALFWLWTRKEAFLKALGTGWDTAASGWPALAPPPGWLWHTFTAAPGYLGALALAGREWQIEHWDWPEKV